jgi:hypothetical protein
MQPGKKRISFAMAVTMIATVLIILVVGTYAALSFNRGGSETSITCSESIATFTVIQNGTAEAITYPIPAEPCQHQISLIGFALTTNGSSNQLTGNVNVNSRSPLATLILYVNGTYELFNDFARSGSTHYSIQYNSPPLNNETLPIITGMRYTIEFVALFNDGTATTAATTVNAT